MICHRRPGRARLWMNYRYTVCYWQQIDQMTLQFGRRKRRQIQWISSLVGLCWHEGLGPCCLCTRSFALERMSFLRMQNVIYLSGHSRGLNRSLCHSSSVITFRLLSHCASCWESWSHSSFTFFTHCWLVYWDPCQWMTSRAICLLERLAWQTLVRLGIVMRYPYCRAHWYPCTLYPLFASYSRQL